MTEKTLRDEFAMAKCSCCQSRYIKNAISNNSLILCLTCVDAIKRFLEARKERGE